MYTGSCLCGSIRYEADCELENFSYCHCRSCRKASGSAFAANASVPREKLRFTDGMETLREYESSPGKFRAFCGKCGSPVYAYLASSRDTLRLRLGTLDSPFTGRPKFHIFVSEKAPWDAITDGIVQFPEWPKAKD